MIINKIQSTEHFGSGGDNYQRHRPTYPIEIIKALIKHVPAQKLAVDVGCGTGQFTQLLTPYFDRILASDVSESQIANASSHPKIEYRVEHSDSLNAADQSTDLITVAQAAHWFDLPVFYQEVNRIAKPGAIIALLSYGILQIGHSPSNNCFQSFYHSDMGNFWPPERAHVEDGYTNLDFPFKKIDIGSFEIKRQWSRDDFIGYISTWSALRQAANAGHSDLFQQFKDNIANVWPDGIEHRVTWPLSTRVGIIEM